MSFLMVFICSLFAFLTGKFNKFNTHTHTKFLETTMTKTRHRANYIKIKRPKAMFCLLNQNTYNLPLQPSEITDLISYTNIIVKIPK